MLTDPILDAWLLAVDAVAAEHAELAPWFGDRQALVDAADHLEGTTWVPGEALLQAYADERHALLLAAGSVEVLQAGDTVRLLKAPVTLGTFGFAVGQPRAATVKALSAATTLTLGRQTIADLGRLSPVLAIGLLRWLALDTVAWLAATRGRADIWSRAHGMAGADRRFQVLPPGRHPLDPDSAQHALAANRLAAVRALQGADLRPLLAAVGEQIHLVGVDAGAAVVSDGDDDRSLLVLLDGAASVRNANGEVLGRFDGDSELSADVLLGERGFLVPAGRDGTVIADRDCLLLEVPHAASRWLADTHPDAAFRIHLAVLRSLCWRLRELDAERARTASILAGDLDAWLAG